eukprot:jgi/Tetstr1/421861/TSEL_012761.t1
MNTAQLRGKLTWWATRLSEYDFAHVDVRRLELSAWAQQRVLDAAKEGAGDGDFEAVTGELSPGPRRGDPWVNAEAMVELHVGSINMPPP